MTSLLAPQILLSLTLLVSGIAKLGHAEGTQDAMRSLRLPAVRTHAAVARVLPVAEIVLALAVWVPVPTVQIVVTVLILALVIAYLVIIARALRFPEKVTCSCFGTLASPTVSRDTLLRNILLVMLAVVAVPVAAAGIPAAALLDRPLVLLGWMVALVATVLLTVFALGGTNAAPVEQPTPSAPRTDSAEPALAAEADPNADDLEADLDYERRPTPFGLFREEDGSLVTLREATAEGALLLLWLNPGCGPCERVFDHLPAWREALEPFVTLRSLIPAGISVVDDASRERAGAVAEDPEHNLASSLGALGTPSAVLLGADGMLAGGPVSGATDVIEFVSDIAQQLQEAQEDGELALPDPDYAPAD